MTDKAAVLGIIEANPGATEGDVYKELIRRSRAARWFGADSILAVLLGPSCCEFIDQLDTLEEEGALTSHWGVSSIRCGWVCPRHYYAIYKKDHA